MSQPLNEDAIFFSLRKAIERLAENNSPARRIEMSSAAYARLRREAAPLLTFPAKRGAQPSFAGLPISVYESTVEHFAVYSEEPLRT